MTQPAAGMSLAAAPGQRQSQLRHTDPAAAQIGRRSTAGIGLQELASGRRQRKGAAAGAAIRCGAQRHAAARGIMQILHRFYRRSASGVRRINAASAGRLAGECHRGGSECSQPDSICITCLSSRQKPEIHHRPDIRADFFASSYSNPRHCRSGQQPRPQRQVQHAQMQQIQHPLARYALIQSR